MKEVSNQPGHSHTLGLTDISSFSPDIIVKEEPNSENSMATNTSAAPRTNTPPGDDLKNTQFSDMLKRIKVEHDSTHSASSTSQPQDELLLPYPSYNFESDNITTSESASFQQGADVYDMIRRTAKDVVTSLQHNTAHLEINQCVGENGEGSFPSNLPVIGYSAAEAGKDMNGSTLPTIQYTEPHFLNSAENTQRSKPSNPFQIDQNQLHSVPVSQQSEELQNLGLTVYNQDDLEAGIMAQVDQALAKEEETRLVKMIEKELKAVKEDVRYNDLNFVLLRYIFL